MNARSMLTVLLGAAFFVASAIAAPPVPVYSSNVVNTDKTGKGSVVITTNDPVDTVLAFYRKNIGDGTGEKTTSDGAHIFYTKSGATVDVEVGNRFDPGTKIALTWDAVKYGGL